LKRRG
jgi:hypothetical protein